MGVLRGSLTYSRFTTSGELPRGYREKFLKALRVHGFEPLQPDDEEQERSGWCVIDRVTDVELTADKVVQGPYWALGYRVDRWRIPSSVFKTHVAEQSDKLLAKSGREKLGKRELAEVKALVRTRLRKKYDPTSRVFDVCWHPQDGVVRVWTHSKRLLTDFAALFEKTFGMTLVFESPYTAAERADLEPAQRTALKVVDATHFHAEPKGSSKPIRRKATSEDLIERIETTRFLGSEFLLWLWCTSELCNGRIELPSLGEVELWLGKLLEFVAPLQPAERVSVRGAAPSATAESREALRQGKLPMKSRLFARVADREFAWQLVAENLAVATGSVPEVLADDSDEAFLERMELIAELDGVVHALYKVFLRLRLSERWANEVVPVMRSWVLEQRVDTARYARSLLHADAPERARSRDVPRLRTSTR